MLANLPDYVSDYVSNVIRPKHSCTEMYQNL